MTTMEYVSGQENQTERDSIINKLGKIGAVLSEALEPLTQIIDENVDMNVAKLGAPINGGRINEVHAMIAEIERKSNRLMRLAKIIRGDIG